MEIVEQILGMTWLVLCLVILGFTIASYIISKMSSPTNRLEENIKNYEIKEKKHRERSVKAKRGRI